MHEQTRGIQMKKLLIRSVMFFTVFLCVWCSEPLFREKAAQIDNETSYQKIEEAANFKPYVIHNMLHILENIGISGVMEVTYGEDDLAGFLDLLCKTGKTYRVYLEETGYVYAIEDLQCNKLIYYIVE